MENWFCGVVYAYAWYCREGCGPGRQAAARAGRLRPGQAGCGPGRQACRHAGSCKCQGERGMRGRLGKSAGSRTGAACDHVIPDNSCVLMSTGMRASFADAGGGAPAPAGSGPAAVEGGQGRLALRLHVRRGRMPASGRGSGGAARGGAARGRAEPARGGDAAGRRPAPGGYWEWQS